jgi:hypothetical protein
MFLLDVRLRRQLLGTTEWLPHRQNATHQMSTILQRVTCAIRARVVARWCPVERPSLKSHLSHIDLNLRMHNSLSTSVPSRRELIARHRLNRALACQVGVSVHFGAFVAPLRWH